MPAVSEKQRRAMYAAASGHSTLGIPQSVGKEFVAADAVNGHAAGILYVAPDGDVLLLRRSSTEKNYAGHWALPGGKGEDGETPEQTADREAREEMGSIPESATGMRLLDRNITPDKMAFHTFAQSVPEKFVPTLNEEHSGYAWCPLHQLPAPMHPAVHQTLTGRLGIAEDMTLEDWEGLRSGFVKWTQEEEAEVDHAQDAIAMDRDSVRRIDGDGHMFVETTPISKANVNPYYGREIPGWNKLGLDPDRIYQMYRDPDELAHGASSFAGKPLMLVHKPISADEHPREVVVGSIGDDVQFKAPYLMAPLNVWDAEAIALIDSEEQRELSSGYRYTPDMTPGKTPDGEAYDGVMRNISANHLALVANGRAGKDVLVMDSAIATQKGRVGPNGDIQQETPMKKKALLSRKASVAHGAIIAYLMPKMAQDAQIDLTPVFHGITSKNFETKKSFMVDGIKKATAGKLAHDADIEDVVGLIDALKTVEVAEGEDEMEPNAGGPVFEKKAEDEGGVREFLASRLSDEDMQAYEKMMATSQQSAMDEDEEEVVEKEKEKDVITKPAMDAAIAAAVKKVQETARAVRAAEDDVRPYIGNIAMACDSADDVYRTALTSLNVDVAGVHPSAFKAILKTIPVPGAATIKTTSIAMDAKNVSSFHEMFPAAKTHVVKHI